MATRIWFDTAFSQKTQWVPLELISGWVNNTGQPLQQVEVGSAAHAVLAFGRIFRSSPEGNCWGLGFCKFTDICMWLVIIKFETWGWLPHFIRRSVHPCGELSEGLCWQLKNGLWNQNSRNSLLHGKGRWWNSHNLHT